MDRSYQLYLFVLSTTTLFTDVKPAGDVQHNWFDAQKQCLGHGLTIERDKSDQPYWTGIYRRLTPWINMLGCYPDSTDLLQHVVNKTFMILSSVGICQEICYRRNGYRFAVKMNNCLCIESDVHVNSTNRLSPSDCNFKCEDNTDVIYSGDCGGTSAYNLYEIQEVSFKTEHTCLSLQCSIGDRRFIPKECSQVYDKVCEKFNIPDNGFASSWNLSMEQCRKSRHSAYVLGEVILSNPRLVCIQIPFHFSVVWVGVRRQKYTNVDRGWEINEEQRETFLDCQMCERNVCQFRSCFDFIASSIFCKDISDRFQGETTSTLMSNHSTSDVMFALRSTTGNHDQHQLPTTNDRLQTSGTNEDLVLKISLPLTVGFITLILCVVGVVLYKRRRKMTKSERTTKTEVKSVSKQQVYSELDFAQSNSSFALEHCYQKISKGSYPLIESPYNNQEGVNDYSRDKQTGKTEVDDVTFHISTHLSDKLCRLRTKTYSNSLTNTTVKNKQ